MENHHKSHYLRLFFWFALTGFMLAGFGVASIIDTTEQRPLPPMEYDKEASHLLGDLQRLGLLRNGSEENIEDLLVHQRKTKRSLVKILREPYWQERLGLQSAKFKSTWYAANPFDLLPLDLQVAIKQKKIPMGSRAELERWCKINKAPPLWVKSLKAALQETTTTNLLRAAEGKRPYTRNGQFLEPIVVEKGKGQFDVFDGHIATDPRVIPTNSHVLMIVKIKGEERILRVKATDVGQAIRGYHVDLPIQFKRKSSVKHSPVIYFPKEYIGNPSVLILSPRKFSPDQKA